MSVCINPNYLIIVLRLILCNSGGRFDCSVVRRAIESSAICVGDRERKLGLYYIRIYTRHILMLLYVAAHDGLIQLHYPGIEKPTRQTEAASPGAVAGPLLRPDGRRLPEGIRAATAQLLRNQAGM